MVIITAFQAEDDSSILLSRSLLIIDEIMKETSFKAGVIGGVFTFLVSGPGIKYVLRDSEKGGLCVLNP